MALVSPGVQVSVIDESFYTPAEPGTLPMIFVATASNKPNGANTSTAPGTLAVNAGVPYLLTSQRDLVDTFGDPLFQVDTNNNPVHGSELNEYGLQAAYSYLGIANRAFVVRADVDLAELEPQSNEPGADPDNGTYWLDTSSTLWGIQQWNGDTASEGGQIFTNKVPLVLTSSTEVENTGSLQTNGFAGEIPVKTIGSVGDYAVVATTTLNKIFYRNAAGTWVLIGSDPWTASWPTIQGTQPNAQAVTGTLIINGETITLAPGDLASDIATKINDAAITGVTAASVNNRLEIYSDGTSSAAADSTLGGEIEITDNSLNSENLKAFGIFPTTANYSTKVFNPPILQVSKHTQIPGFKVNDTTPRPTGSIWLKTTTPNLGAKFTIKQWNNDTALWESVDAPVYSSNEEAIYNLDKTGGGSNLLTGSVYVKANVANDARPLGTYKIYRRNDVAPTSITSDKVTSTTFTSAASYDFTIQATDKGSLSFGTSYTISFTANGDSALDAALVASEINDAGIANVTATVDAQNKITIKHSLGGEFKITEGLNTPITLLGFSPYVSQTVGTPNLYYAPGTDISTNPNQYVASLWKTLSYTGSEDAPANIAEEGTLWYNSIVDEADILVHNGDNFVGYLYDGSSGETSTASPFYSAVAAEQTDPEGPIVAASIPTTQSDGTALVTGDLWIDTSDLENYPKIYKFNAARTDLVLEKRWFEVDLTDQTTEEGILFADARYNTNGVDSNKAGDIADLLLSDFVDPDSPDPALYPKGMLLFNTRRSGFNVKKYHKNYINTVEKNDRYNEQSMSDYHTDRWVTESGNQEDGSGSFGRKAQRKVVVQSLQALVNSNEEIRDNESRLFNLMACPGYPELIGEMKTLNYDRGLSAFIVGDSPFRLAANATMINNWANNNDNAVEDNDIGLITTDPYLAVFYPSGYTSDNFGNNVVVPASHMMLRTIALSDQVSYPWFAPAGTRRGGITNATSTGYITSEGEFKAVSLNEGLRDTLYANNVNPITFITGAGLVNFGQKTRQLAASALDRINVARLVIYLRSQLNVLAKPYLFEPNDKITRDEIKQACETLLLELVGLRALYDFLVVCDETNNTPARIDRNELYVDIAVEPVKAIEFIYIPMRLKNTGEIAGL